eukprot:TRINITY_DN2843_c0_g1_i2.p2 TRINITY_DN2843_c0_g1~~TRINITY_DN2843_c0_g1_i2.p2  ORF type:complete len:105 (-),score=32.81 TRINITY_DN2843_c0_g1_i2:84-398(-)
MTPSLREFEQLHRLGKAAKPDDLAFMSLTKGGGPGSSQNRRGTAVAASAAAAETAVGGVASQEASSLSQELHDALVAERALSSQATEGGTSQTAITGPTGHLKL